MNAQSSHYTQLIKRGAAIMSRKQRLDVFTRALLSRPIFDEQELCFCRRL